MNEMIRRAAPGLALAGAALSVVWLIDPAFDAETESAAAGGSPAAASSAQSDDQATDSGTDPSSADSGTGTDSGTADSAASSASSGDCSDPAAMTGDAVDTQWGPVQVRMEFAADGTVCSVAAIAYPQDDPHSARINAVAIPQLDAQAAEVGVEFDAISGATFTSQAYRDSMQSILDKR